MYDITLTLHSLLRWAVLIFAVVALYRAYSGWLGAKAWSDQDRRWNVFFAHSLTAQFVIGLLLYFVLSPITTSAFADFGAAMKDRVWRFWAVEHIFTMFIALAFAHIGSARARKAETDTAKHKTAAIFFTLSLVLTLISIPWSFLSYGRPLFRFF